MTDTTDSNYPGGSKNRVTAAGERFRLANHTEDDMKIFEEWRAAHRPVLNTFQAILRIRTRGKNISVAQRHKRKSTILDKLSRFPKMQLSRMDDIAGCRLIFDSIDELYAFRRTFHRARFSHRLKNDVDKYDYIRKPKTTGYRGIHDIYVYDVNSDQGKHLRGLSIEIQYRTTVQHSWATAVELIGFITESQPKFQQGDKRYVAAMALASEIIARAHEQHSGPHPELKPDELLATWRHQERELGLMRTLRGIEATEIIKSKKKNAILIFPNVGELRILTYESAPEALRELFRLEKEQPGSDIVLVRADTNDAIRLAYKNYFSDAREFVHLVEEGCRKLESA